MYIIQNADEIITARGVDFSVTLCYARWRAGSAPTYLQFETHDVICHFSAKYPNNVAHAFLVLASDTLKCIHQYVKKL